MVPWIAVVIGAYCIVRLAELARRENETSRVGAIAVSPFLLGMVIVLASCKEQEPVAEAAVTPKSVAPISTPQPPAKLPVEPRPVARKNPSPPPKAPKEVVPVHVLSAGLYYDAGDEQSGRLRVLLSTDKPLLYELTASRGSRKGSWQKLDVTENTDSGGPYPILGRYFQVGGLSVVKSSRYIRVGVTRNGKRVAMDIGNGKIVDYYILEMEGSEDSTGWSGECTEATYINNR